MNQLALLAVLKEGLWPDHRAPPNKHMQRAVRHKVLGRGRSDVLLSQVRFARVLTRRRAGADVNRWATVPTAALEATHLPWNPIALCGRGEA
jgi:hypothetical protein